VVDWSGSRYLKADLSGGFCDLFVRDVPAACGAVGSAGLISSRCESIYE
jgi:hypothetical protein